MGIRQTGARAIFLALACLLLPACLSVDGEFPVEVSPKTYVLLTAPAGTAQNPEVLRPAARRAEAYCRESGEQAIAIKRRPSTIVKDGKDMDVLYFTCIANPAGPSAPSDRRDLINFP
jgi:hypothetical protein